MINPAILKQVVVTIIQHQQLIIGALAIDQARKVAGLSIVKTEPLDVNVTTSNPQNTLLDLTSKYAELFGTTSIEVCKDAIKSAKISVKPEDLPEVLR